MGDKDQKVKRTDMEESIQDLETRVRDKGAPNVLGDIGYAKLAPVNNDVVSAGAGEVRNDDSGSSGKAASKSTSYAGVGWIQLMGNLNNTLETLQKAQDKYGVIVNLAKELKKVEDEMNKLQNHANELTMQIQNQIKEMNRIL